MNNLGIISLTAFTGQVSRLSGSFKALLCGTLFFLNGCHAPGIGPKFSTDNVHVPSNNGTLIVRPLQGDPLLGQIQKTHAGLTFTPQFPFLAGQTYEAVFIGADGRQSAAVHTFPIEAKAPELLEVFPSGDTVPANHLKFYLHFSERMAQGNIFRHFRLIDLATGKPIEEPFRETELWSEDGKRLTLWLHPGRQKTGVNLNVDLGPVLEPRQRYALEIAPDWESEAGMALAQAERKVFTAEPVDHTQPEPRHWTVSAPQAGSRRPLILTFEAPLDWALLHTMLTVLDARDEGVRGTLKVTRHETQWRFVPDRPWSAGIHRVRIGWELEDLAGNNLLRLFEVNLEQPQAPAFAGPRYLEFRTR